MNVRQNHLQQPIGFAIDDWQPRPKPGRDVMVGKHCRVEAIDVERHAGDLFAANQLDQEGRNWTYLGNDAFDRVSDYRTWMEATCLGEDPLFHAIVDAKTDRAIGVASYLRIEPNVGVIEVGHINYSPALQGTTAATEAMFLMMQRVFDELGYRRYEWKCDNHNLPSRAAAARLGFTYEGLFRQATIYKGRNRDTAWFSILDSEWPALRSAYLSWLADDNFTADGKQISSLKDLRQS